MNRVTRIISVLGAGAIALALTACGGGGDSEYCDLITSATENASLAESDPTDEGAMEEASNTFREIADAAPDDISDDWNAVADAWASPEIDEEAFAAMSDTLEALGDNVQQECDIQM